MCSRLNGDIQPWSMSMHRALCHTPDCIFPGCNWSLFSWTSVNFCPGRDAIDSTRSTASSVAAMAAAETTESSPHGCARKEKKGAGVSCTNETALITSSVSRGRLKTTTVLRKTISAQQVKQEPPERQYGHRNGHTSTRPRRARAESLPTSP